MQIHALLFSSAHSYLFPVVMDSLTALLQIYFENEKVGFVLFVFRIEGLFISVHDYGI